MRFCTPKQISLKKVVLTLFANFEVESAQIELKKLKSYIRNVCTVEQNLGIIYRV
jgi:hypothetical protein